MAQTITDYSAFLTDAREAVEELAGLERREAELEAQEKRLERTLEAEKKAVADAIHSTIRRRNEEICSSYDKEIAKGQERLKKIRSKREKAKSQGVKDRIAEETSEIRSHNRELRIKMRTLFQQKHVPFFCNSGCYYALFSPRGVREFFALFCAMLVCFLAVLRDLLADSGEDDRLSVCDLFLCHRGVRGALYRRQQLDQRPVRRHPAGGTGHPQPDPDQQPDDAGDHEEYKEGQGRGHLRPAEV